MVSKIIAKIYLFKKSSNVNINSSEILIPNPPNPLFPTKTNQFKVRPRGRPTLTHSYVNQNIYAPESRKQRKKEKNRLAAAKCRKNKDRKIKYGEKLVERNKLKMEQVMTCNSRLVLVRDELKSLKDRLLGKNENGSPPITGYSQMLSFLIDAETKITKKSQADFKNCQNLIQKITADPESKQSILDREMYSNIINRIISYLKDWKAQNIDDNQEYKKLEISLLGKADNFSERILREKMQNGEGSGSGLSMNALHLYQQLEERLGGSLEENDENSCIVVQGGRRYVLNN